jgi:hypothetical protein
MSRRALRPSSQVAVRPPIAQVAGRVREKRRNQGRASRRNPLDR